MNNEIGIKRRYKLKLYLIHFLNLLRVVLFSIALEATLIVIFKLCGIPEWVNFVFIVFGVVAFYFLKNKLKNSLRWLAVSVVLYLMVGDFAAGFLINCK